MQLFGDTHWEQRLQENCDEIIERAKALGRIDRALHFSACGITQDFINMLMVTEQLNDSMSKNPKIKMRAYKYLYGRRKVQQIPKVSEFVPEEIAEEFPEEFPIDESTDD